MKTPLNSKQKISGEIKFNSAKFDNEQFNVLQKIIPGLSDSLFKLKMDVAITQHPSFIYTVENSAYVRFNINSERNCVSGVFHSEYERETIVVGWGYFKTKTIERTAEVLLTASLFPKESIQDTSDLLNYPEDFLNEIEGVLFIEGRVFNSTTGKEEKCILNVVMGMQK